jgi:hypothetical protein
MTIDVLMAVAGWSPESRAINRAMNSGSVREDLGCAPPVMLADPEDQRTFDDTSGGTRSRVKAWW